MGVSQSTPSNPSDRFPPPAAEAKHETHGSFNGGINQTLPNEILENGQTLFSDNISGGILSTRGSKDDLTKYSDRQSTSPEKQVLTETEHKSTEQFDFTRRQPGHRDNLRQESTSELNANVTFAHLSSNTTKMMYPSTSDIIAPLYGEYPKVQNPIHILMGNRVISVMNARTIEDVVYVPELVDVLISDIKVFSYNMEDQVSEALVQII